MSQITKICHKWPTSKLLNWQILIFEIDNFGEIAKLAICKTSKIAKMGVSKWQKSPKFLISKWQNSINDTF